MSDKAAAQATKEEAKVVEAPAAKDVEKKESKNGKIPVTILTGFLGAGKTTFVNYMMKANHGHKMAIIENEFGEVGIDHDLVMQTGEEVVEMLNGCICCTVRNDLIGALKRLYENRRDQFDYIIIETTGMADPAPVAQTFFVEEELRKLFYLDAIVTFVDCKNTPAHLREEKANGAENEAVEQVAFADVLVLNKTDLVDEKGLEEVKKQLRGINATAKMLTCQQSKIPLESVLEIRAFDLEKTVEMDEEFLNTEAEHKHDKSVTSVGFVIEGSFHPTKFNDWLSKFLQEKAQDVFRSKGVFSIVGSDDRYVFQAVHMIMNMGSSDQMGCNFPPFGPDEKRVNKMCFIGKNLNREELYKGLLACVHDGKKIVAGEPPKTKLRFKVGTRVQCNVGTWETGTVVKHWYREDYWESDRFAAYQVKLDGQDALIYVPNDISSLCRPAPKK